MILKIFRNKIEAFIKVDYENPHMAYMHQYVTACIILNILQVSSSAVNSNISC